MRILNLYAGIGGNRKLWGDEHEITAVEWDKNIAKIYQDFFPEDKMIIADAHQYLLDHYSEFDIIWSSPPCQSHTRFIRSGKNRKPRYPNMQLYEEILFLEYNFDGNWVVENVVPYYKPFLSPAKVGRHLVWSNCDIPEKDYKTPDGFIMKCNTEGANELKKLYGLKYDGNIYYKNNHDPAQILRNCVEPELGEYILSKLLKGD